MTYRIGIDSGGTRSRLGIFVEGSEVMRIEDEGLNYNCYSEEAIQESIERMLRRVWECGYLLEDCEGIGVGTAGISNPAAIPFLETCFRNAGYMEKLVVKGDQDAALQGAFGGDEGILLISGTGSICVARDRQKTVIRVGGYGHLMDDEGSAYSIGKNILRAVVYAKDGRGPETCLTEQVLDYLSRNSLEEVIAYIYGKEIKKKDIAELAVCIGPAYQMGDTAAVSIVNREIDLLVHMTEVIRRRMNSGFEQDDKKKNIPLVLSGGMFQKNDWYSQLFEKKVRELQLKIVFQNSQGDSVRGAADFISD